MQNKKIDVEKRSGEKKKRKMRADYYGHFYERILALDKSSDIVTVY